MYTSKEHFIAIANEIIGLSNYMEEKLLKMHHVDNVKNLPNYFRGLLFAFGLVIDYLKAVIKNDFDENGEFIEVKGEEEE